MRDQVGSFGCVIEGKLDVGGLQDREAERIGSSGTQKLNVESSSKENEKVEEHWFCSSGRLLRSPRNVVRRAGYSHAHLAPDTDN